MLNASFAGELTDGTTSVLKFTGDMRATMIDGLSKEQLWCENNTFHQILDTIGLRNEPLCG